MYFKVYDFNGDALRSSDETTVELQTDGALIQATLSWRGGVQPAEVATVAKLDWESPQLELSDQTRAATVMDSIDRTSIDEIADPLLKGGCAIRAAKSLNHGTPGLGDQQPVMWDPVAVAQFRPAPANLSRINPTQASSRCRASRRPPPLMPTVPRDQARARAR